MPYPEPECPHCHRALSDYISNLPEKVFVSVDVPLDILEAEWVIKTSELRMILKYLNDNRKGRLKFNIEVEK